MDLPSISAVIPSAMPPGGARAVLDASVDAVRRGVPATLALVLETSGSTYVRAGAMALFDGDGTQVGWLSGGCLEPEIARRAQDAARGRRLDFMEIDTRFDEDLLSGSAVGCRGRLRLALLPLAALGDWPARIAAWRDGAALHVCVHRDGALDIATRDDTTTHRLAVLDPAWTDAPSRWTLDVPPAPSVIVFGAGPETPFLLPMLRALGATTTLVERRPRWSAAGALADHAPDLTPTQALLAATRRHDVALVMHHNFELDREALHALASAPIGFVGLLGPVRRRDDLFRVLPPPSRDALLPRLHSPVGLHLGGSGPEAIALSIAAQLQRHLHGVPA
ncbi:XdhC family protein [Lysobacter auxotrophicus]|uniref:XdhC family protein n=1 Tax=Lysobacter auxotrophicus TaxID=2992573 RepID=A0ABM8D9N6_9GAMM|nr:XdhC/CoxI family protein [Lysobacter auxotrophicus]BDU15232.1 XdhC family protein [Lysobacter auxotrophicus]